MATSKESWIPHIGRKVVAKNYAGDTGVGTLLAVTSGVWGYSGCSVALQLDIRDEKGLNFWPASLCILPGHVLNTES